MPMNIKRVLRAIFGKRAQAPKVDLTEALNATTIHVHRIIEFDMSDCRYGCKWYRCEGQNCTWKALYHNATYGCRSTDHIQID